MRTSLSILFLLASSTTFADASTGYTTGSTSNKIYQVNLENGSSSAVTPSSILGAELTWIALEDHTTAYAVGLSNGSIYRINLKDGSRSTVATMPGILPYAIALANPSTAYIAAASDAVYRMDLKTGNYSLVAQTPGGGGIDCIALDNMTLGTATTAYTAGFASVFRIDLVNNQATKIAQLPGVNISGISLGDNNVAYLATSNSKVYTLDLNSNQLSLLTPTAATGAGLNGLDLANNATAYTVGFIDNKVYLVDLIRGTFSPVTASAISGASLTSISLLLQIPTAHLGGNNLSFADYLNQNASMLTMTLFCLQSDVAQALESAAPTRNAILTFSAQTTQIAFGKLIYDHLGQKRCNRAWHRPEPKPTMQPNADLAHFLVDAFDVEASSEPEKTETLNEIGCFKSDKNKSSYSTWLGILGEYTKEKAQNQTPGFETGSGGFVACFDYQKNETYLHPLVGAGIAYAHTHIHEENGAGFANIDQGALAFYTGLAHSKWYLDLTLWAGLYHAHNVRNISFPSIAGSASASTNGWQITPHFEVGYDWDKVWFSIEPFEMLDWVACWEEKLTETGAGRLNMGQKGRFCSLLRNELGLRFNETLSYEWGNITFREKGSYVYQKTFHTGTITAYLIGSPGSFSVSTLIGAQNLGVGEFEILFVPQNKKYPYGTMSYQGEFGSRYQSHQGMVTVGLDF